MNTAAGSTIDQDPNMASALVTRGDNDVRISGVDYEFIDTCMLINGKNRFPRCSPIRCSVETTIATITPERSLCGDKHFIRVFRVNPDLTNVPRCFEPHVSPRLATVDGLIDAITRSNATLRVVLTRAYPQCVTVIRVNLNDANGVRGFAIKQGLPSRATVCGPEYSARRNARNKGLITVWVESKIRNTT